MSKARLYFVIAAVNFFCFLLQAFSGFVLWLVIPRGSGDGDWRGGRGSGAASFIFDRHTWLDIHEWTAVALLCLILVHVALHYKWIVRMLKSLRR